MIAALAWPTWPLRALRSAGARADECSACAPATAEAARWDDVLLSHAAPSDEAPPTSAGESLARGESVIVIPGVATALECDSLRAAGVIAADAQRETRVLAGLKDATLVRVHPIPSEVQSASDALLLRVLAFVDREFPAIRTLLFGADAATLCELFETGSLEYSCREPAINVYRESGEFNPHKDHQALTVLIPLSDPTTEFRGGCTGFWAPDSRGHRVEPPAVVLRPPRGSALVFGGHVIHAGMQVQEGVRVAYVASFSAQGRCGRPDVG